MLVPLLMGRPQTLVLSLSLTPELSECYRGTVTAVDGASNRVSLRLSPESAALPLPMGRMVDPFSLFDIGVWCPWVRGRCARGGGYAVQLVGALVIHAHREHRL